MKIRPEKVHGRRRWCVDARQVNKGGCISIPRQTQKRNSNRSLSSAGILEKYGWRFQHQNGVIWSGSIPSEESKSRNPVCMGWLSEIRDQRVGTSKTLSAAIIETIEANAAPSAGRVTLPVLKHISKPLPVSREHAHKSNRSRGNRSMVCRSKEAPNTQNSNLGRLSALFDHCWRRHYIPENPCRRVEQVSVNAHTPTVLSNLQSWRSILWARRQKPEFLAWLTLTLFADYAPNPKLTPLIGPSLI